MEHSVTSPSGVAISALASNMGSGGLLSISNPATLKV